MKSRTLCRGLLLLALCAFLSLGANPSLARAYRSSGPPGQLIIRTSPVLPFDVGLTIQIDGRHAGVLAKGHIFRQDLAPGPHLIYVTRGGRGREAWQRILHVRPGETYTFVAKYQPTQVVLEPARPYWSRP
jgi:hypothetical protein